MVSLRDRTGGRREKVDFDVHVYSICVSPTTDNLWACALDNNGIMELASGTPVTRFYTDREPMCLCVTTDNHIVVGMMGKVTKFTTAGKQIITTDKSQSGNLSKKTQVYSPWNIDQCRVTRNLAVVDRDEKRHGGNGKPHVIVIDTDLREIYRYHGDNTRVHQKTSQKTSYTFDAYDVAFDSVGNLVIVDCDNKCLHLLSSSGEYLRLLHTDTGEVRAVGVDRSNLLWASVCHDGEPKKVKLLQYHSSVWE